MSANISDYFNKASDMSGDYPAVATVNATRSAGATVLSCDDLTGWATDTPVHFSTFQVLADGSIDTTTQTDWKGIVSGNTITDLRRLAGAADSGNASGDRVELNPTIGWLDDLIVGLLISHKQDGTLKDGIVSTSKIADDAVTAAKIADGAIDSYAQIADNTILARNLDLSTMDFGNFSTSEVDTGFTWIDGKKIYKKSMQNTLSGSVNEIDVSSLNIDLLIDWRNTVKLPTGAQTVIGFRTGGAGSFDYLMMATQFNRSPDKLKMEFGLNFQGSKTVYSTIWYTKAS